MPNGWRTIKSLEHKIRLHGRRGKGMAESFSREKLRHAPQKKGGREILFPPVWPRLVRPTNLISIMNGKKTHTHRDEQADAGRDGWTRPARPNFQARTRTGEYSFSLFSWPRPGLAALPGWCILCYMWWPYIRTCRVWSEVFVTSIIDPPLGGSTRVA